MEGNIIIKLAFLGAAIFAILILGIISVEWLRGISRAPEADKKYFTPAIITISMVEFMALIFTVFGVIS